MKFHFRPTLTLMDPRPIAEKRFTSAKEVPEVFQNLSHLKARKKLKGPGQDQIGLNIRVRRTMNLEKEVRKPPKLAWTIGREKGRDGPQGKRKEGAIPHRLKNTTSHIEEKESGMVETIDTIEMEIGMREEDKGFNSHLLEIVYTQEKILTITSPPATSTNKS